MKFDLHCHTKEGSLDSRVSVREFADRFMELGYDGFMISDHNSYKGCWKWDAIKKEEKYKNFTVIRGMEYDTKDAGHVLVIMPDDVYLSILRRRGLKCSTLIKIVHAFGGILGLAHPFGVSTSSAHGFKNMDKSLLPLFDFVEVFNTCEFPNSNRRAKEMAEELGLPQFAGSDSHVPEYIGMACTEIEEKVRNNNELIYAVTHGSKITATGTERGITKKAMRKEHWIGRLSFKLYNRGIGKLICPYRSYQRYKLTNILNI